ATTRSPRASAARTSSSKKNGSAARRGRTREAYGRLALRACAVQARLFGVCDPRDSAGKRRVLGVCHLRVLPQRADARARVLALRTRLIGHEGQLPNRDHAETARETPPGTNRTSHAFAELLLKRPRGRA